VTGKWLLAVALLAACSSPKQIVLSIDTTAGIPCDIDRIRVRATATSTETFEQEVNAATRFPLTLRLSDDTSNGAFDLEVSGLLGSTEVLRAAGALQFGSSGPDLAVNVVLEESCTVGSACSLPELVRFSSPPPPVAARFQCGQNITWYELGDATEVFSDACNTPGTNAGKVLNDGSTGAAKLPLSEAALNSFDFRFYGRPVRQIWAHEDGYISFTMNNPDPANDLDAGALDRDLTKTGVPPPPQSAMIFWDTLTLSTTGVCYALEGPAGSQKLRVTWRGTCDIVPCGSDNLNFTIILDEKNDRITFTYGDMISANPSKGQGLSATVGVVNKADGCPVAECNRASGVCSDGRPCGYTQIFSNMSQGMHLPNYRLDPKAPE
jgi:hypothetical protein